MSWPLALSRSLAVVTVTVTLAPAASVPDDGAAVTTPFRLCDGVMDQVTGPFEAVRVRVTERPGRGAIDVGVTVSVPCTGLGVALTVALLVALGLADLGDGVAEPGRAAAPVADGRGPDAGPPPGRLAVGDRPPAAAEGDGFPDRVERAEAGTPGLVPAPLLEIGRASCRERVLCVV